jgi:ABC-type multidrug transport system permease subunit
MDGVRKVADSGRTIVCTIHQPSAEVFHLFDSLLLLQRGGQTVFFGEVGDNCRNIVEYFEAVPGTLPLPEGYNPATWMLECIGAGVSTTIAHDVDFVEQFNSSSFMVMLNEVLTHNGVGQPSSELPEVEFSNKRAADSWTQMRFVVRRYLDMYWRTPSYNLTRIILAAVLALLLGLIVVGSDYDSYQGLSSGVGMIFVATLFMAMVAYQSVLPLTFEERASFYRERAAQTYNAFWYFLASTVAEIPYILVSNLVFTVIFYPMVGFSGFKAGVLFWIGQSMLVMLQTFMGIFFCYALPSEEVAAVIGILFNIIFILFMGFLPPKYAIPNAYTWLYDISPHRYALSIMVSLIFADCDDMPTWNATLGAYEGGGSSIGCQPLRNSPVTVGHITVKEYTEQYFNMKHDDIPFDFAIVAAYIVLFRMLGLLALRYVNHQNK